MKYDVLRAYNDYLLTKYRPATANTYYERLNTLMKNQDIFDVVGMLQMAKIIDELANVKYKSYFSQYKNAFIHFCEFQNISISNSDLLKIKQLHKQTRKKYRNLKPQELKIIKSKINHMKSQKLKLSFLTLLETGLRVSELSQITKSSCNVSDDNIQFSFVGKGGKYETVTIARSKNKKLFDNLKNHIEDTSSSNNVFYSATYLKRKAKEKDFSCHDLRRACAKQEYKLTKNKIEVMKKLRHTSMRNTNIYLRSKVKL